MALEKWDGPVFNELLPLFHTMAGAADTDAAAAARISTDFSMVYALELLDCLSLFAEEINGLEETDDMVTLCFRPSTKMPAST
jgi:hypothetical protein